MPINMQTLLKNKDFDLYWISYLSSHTNPANRICHYLGTSIGVIGGFIGLIFVNIYVGIIVGVTGYSIALLGHFVFQKNSPHATKPHLGIVCDFLMLYLYFFDKACLICNCSGQVINKLTKENEGERKRILIIHLFFSTKGRKAKRIIPPFEASGKQKML